MATVECSVQIQDGEQEHQSPSRSNEAKQNNLQLLSEKTTASNCETQHSTGTVSSRVVQSKSGSNQAATGTEAENGPLLTEIINDDTNGFRIDPANYSPLQNSQQPGQSVLGQSQNNQSQAIVASGSQNAQVIFGSQYFLQQHQSGVPQVEQQQQLPVSIINATPNGSRIQPAGDLQSINLQRPAEIQVQPQNVQFEATVASDSENDQVIHSSQHSLQRRQPEVPQLQQQKQAPVDIINTPPNSASIQCIADPQLINIQQPDQLSVQPQNDRFQTPTSSGSQNGPVIHSSHSSSQQHKPETHQPHQQQQPTISIINTSSDVARIQSPANPQLINMHQPVQPQNNRFQGTVISNSQNVQMIHPSQTSSRQHQPVLPQLQQLPMGGINDAPNSSRIQPTGDPQLINLQQPTQLFPNNDRRAVEHQQNFHYHPLLMTNHHQHYPLLLNANYFANGNQRNLDEPPVNQFLINEAHQVYAEDGRDVNEPPHQFNVPQQLAMDGGNNVDRRNVNHPLVAPPNNYFQYVAERNRQQG
ncbi:putative uncharacterized protein DDB_G0291608 [Fopius arisanus]|uniref:Uncharacterized protein n=1 Tax=Fopius arisanus TaxID=64838 RepID=A0A9R1TEV5_9HYME|nr:PREDICTED: putative uncharacterized protein DDB_G0291608 [Fopius arisanus]